MTYNPSRRPRNPIAVAEMNDANALRGLAHALEQNLDALKTHGAQTGTIHAIQILNGAASALTPGKR